MNVTSIRHFGIKVPNLSKAISFYKKLGLEPIYRKNEDWGSIFGILKIAKMKTPDSKIIEFIEDDNVIDYNCHLCFQVGDLDAIYKKMKKSFLFPPRMSPDNSVYISFCRDCNNMLIELVQS